MRAAALSPVFLKLSRVWLARGTVLVWTSASVPLRAGRVLVRMSVSMPWISGARPLDLGEQLGRASGGADERVVDGERLALAEALEVQPARAGERAVDADLASSRIEYFSGTLNATRMK